jgi:hypothetical protein
MKVPELQVQLGCSADSCGSQVCAESRMLALAWLRKPDDLRHRVAREGAVHRQQAGKQPSGRRHRGLAAEALEAARDKQTAVEIQPSGGGGVRMRGASSPSVSRTASIPRSKASTAST